MALVIGNKTFSNPNPNATSYTQMHNQSVGSNRGLLAVVTMPNNVNFSSATYGAVSMSLVQNILFSSESQRQVAYYLANPNEGFNAFRINFSGSQTNSISIALFSFTGADGIDTNSSNTSVTTPNSKSLTILTNSVIYASGISSNAQNTGYDIGGSTRAFEFSHNTNIVVRGCLSATGLSAGSKNVITKADSGNVTNFRVAVKEYVPATRREIIIC